MIKNKSTAIFAIVTMLLIVSSTANEDVTLVDIVDVEAIDLPVPCAWKHSLELGMRPETIENAELTIDAFGVYMYWNYPVYLEGIYLGDLVGAGHNWANTHTTFPLNEYLTKLLVGPVSIEVGYDEGGMLPKVKTSTITVTYEPEEPLPYGPPAPFTLVVLPHRMVDAIPGQKCVFLVKCIEEGWGHGRDEAVNVSVLDPELLIDTVVTVEPPAILPGQIAEATVILDANADWFGRTASGGDQTLTILIVAERKGLTRTQMVTVNVTQGQDELAEQASDYRDRFIPWLDAIHQELGITAETEWSGTSIKQYMVEVKYYLFFSEQWEMGLRWNVTIPPNDFAEIYLRRRDTNLSSTDAFKIYSLAAYQRPQVVVLPKEGVWR